MDNKIWFERINTYYNTIKADGTRLWTLSQVKVAITKNKITGEEFITIVRYDVDNDKITEEEFINIMKDSVIKEEITTDEYKLLTNEDYVA